MYRSSLAGLVTLLCLTTPAVSQKGKYNDALAIGAPAPAWNNLPGVDGKRHSMADLKDKQVVVLVFTCNSCPAAEDYQDRILSFAKKHAGDTPKVVLVAINVNTIPEDSLPKMIERAKEKNFTFPYLYDETQNVGRLYGATYTPEFFVLDKNRKVAYMGALDDRDNPALAKVNFLENAVDAVLKGEKPAVMETLARGCRIRYLRKKS
jgi:peroxiredoxin